VLDQPQDYRHLGQNGARMIAEDYALDVCLPRMLKLYEDVCNDRASRA
jgi:hypothetical protein